jgi:S1-C subfamily serine protease
MVRTSLKISALVAALLLAAAAGSSHQALAEGALAIGLPRDVSKDGIALGWNTNSPTSAEARRRALEGCRDVKNSTDAARALCKIVGTFHNQCVAGAEDPDPGTPGVGWAVAADKPTAEQKALAMCQAKSPPARRAACKVMTSGCDGSAAPASPGQQPPATPPKAPTGSSSGSGFFLTQAGNVLTNAHVVQGCDDIRIRMIDGSLIRARVVAINEVDDLAVLKADTRAEKVVTLRTAPGSMPTGWGSVHHALAFGCGTEE